MGGGSKRIEDWVDSVELLPSVVIYVTFLDCRSLSIRPVDCRVQ